MATLAKGEMVVLVASAGGDRHVEGAFRATSDVDLDALQAEFAARDAAGGVDLGLPGVVEGRVGAAGEAAAFDAWLVARGLLERVEARTLEVRASARAGGGGRPALSHSLGPMGGPSTRMGADLKARWIRMAAAIWGGGGGTVLDTAQGRGAVRTVTSLLEADGMRWGDAVRRGVVERYARPETVTSGYGDRSLLACEVLRLAWAAETGDAALVPLGSRAPLAAVLTHLGTREDFRRRLTAHRGAARPQPETPLAFGFAYVVPVPRRCPVLCEGEAVLEPVDADAAPVAAVLAGPEGDRIVVRAVDGQLYRTVTSPGSWEPASVDVFKEACLSGEAWRDNPFAPAPDGPRMRGCLGMADVAVPRGRRAGVGRSADAAATAGRLVVVEGIVHRRCPPPTFTTFLDLGGGERERALGVTWRVDHVLNGVEDLGTTMLGPSVARCERHVRDRDWTSLVDGVPLTLADDVVRALRRFVTTSGQAIGGSGTDASGLGVEVLDPSLLPALPHGLASTVAGWDPDAFVRSTRSSVPDADADGRAWAAYAAEVSRSWVSRGRDRGGRAALVVAFAEEHAEMLEDMADVLDVGDGVPSFR